MLIANNSTWDLVAAQVARAQELDHVARQLALAGEFLQLLLDRAQRRLARLKFGVDLAHAFFAAEAREAQSAHDAGQHQPLSDQRYDDDAEHREQNEVAVRERGAAGDAIGKGQSRRQRYHAADAGEGD